jgi:hypothetical protein
MCVPASVALSVEAHAQPVVHSPRQGQPQGRRTRKEVSARVVIEDPGPSLMDPSPSLSRAHGFCNFGEICHSAAMWLF